MIAETALRKIGLLGGMSPESTLEYYRILLELARARLPQDEYPVIIVYSLNFREFNRLMSSRDYGSSALSKPHLFLRSLQGDEAEKSL